MKIENWKLKIKDFLDKIRLTITREVARFYGNRETPPPQKTRSGWFDDKDYFEFYPLHVVYKMKDRKKKKVKFKGGNTVEVPEENEIKVV